MVLDTAEDFGAALRQQREAADRTLREVADVDQTRRAHARGARAQSDREAAAGHLPPRRGARLRPRDRPRSRGHAARVPGPPSGRPAAARADGRAGGRRRSPAVTTRSPWLLVGVVVVAVVVRWCWSCVAAGLGAPVPRRSAARRRCAVRRPRPAAARGVLMDAGIRTPLIDAFRRADVPREVRLDAAHGLVAPRGQEQLALLMLLVDDADAGRARPRPRARSTHCRRRRWPATLARSDTTAEMVRFFARPRHRAGRRRPADDRRAARRCRRRRRRGAEADDDGDGAGEDAELSVTQQIQQMCDRRARARGDEGLARDARDPDPRSEQDGGVGRARRRRS